MVSLPIPLNNLETWYHQEEWKVFFSHNGRDERIKDSDKYYRNALLSQLLQCVPATRAKHRAHSCTTGSDMIYGTLIQRSWNNLSGRSKYCERTPQMTNLATNASVTICKRSFQSRYRRMKLLGGMCSAFIATTQDDHSALITMSISNYVGIGYDSAYYKFLATGWSVLILRPYSKRNQLPVRTKHDWPVWILKLEDAPGSSARCRLCLSKFEFDVVHLDGNKHRNLS